jgi:hypothetical protein
MKKSVSPLESACKKYEEDLVLYYYGEQSDSERRRVDQHLADCHACCRFVNDLRGLLPHIAQAEELPQSFWDNYYRETMAKLTEQQERRNWWRTLLTPMQGWMVPAFGTAAVAVLAIALVLEKGNLNFFKDPAPVNIPQEILADSDQLEFFESLDMLESLNKLEEQDGKRSEPKTSQLNKGAMSTTIA